MSFKIKIGLVGCGRAAELIYLPAINKFSNIEVKGVIDLIKERRELIASQFNDCYQSNLIDSNFIERIDGAIISSPPDSHVAAASELLKNNKCVLVEKPLSLSMEGIKTLQEVESSSKASLMMGFNHRYWSPAAKLKEELSASTRIDYAEMVFLSNFNKWNPVSFVSDPLDDLGPHVFDLIKYIFNKEIISISANRVGENEFDLVVRIAEDFYIHCYIAHSNDTIKTIRVTSSGGKYFLSLKSARITPEAGFLRNVLDFNDRVKTKLLRKISPISLSYEVQLRKFLDFVISGKAAQPGTEEGISAVLAVEAARMSINDNGKEIYLNEI